MLSMNSLAAADYLLITLQCEYMALEGLGPDPAQRRAPEDRRHQPGARTRAASS